MKGKLPATAAIDLGLAILAATTKGAQTQHTIACYCGCTPQRIDQIEKRALRKCRAALYRDKELQSELKDIFKR